MTGMDASSRKALWIIVSGFSIVLAVNLTLVYFAISSWTGLSTEQPFVKGLAYNRNLEGARRQQALGWRMEMNTTFNDHESSTKKISGIIGIGFSDRDGQPLTDLDVKMYAVRPTREGFDRVFLPKHVGHGVYQTTFALPLRGVWDLRVVARRGDNDFQRVERIVTP